MNSKTNRERAKERAFAAYDRLRNVRDAAMDAGVPISSLREWLKAAGVKVVDVSNRTPLQLCRQPERRSSVHEIENMPRVDRDPCPKCNTRKDIGCKHFPKQPDPAPAPTDRERAEAMWSKRT